MVENKQFWRTVQTVSAFTLFQILGQGTLTNVSATNVSEDAAHFQYLSFIKGVPISCPENPVSAELLQSVDTDPETPVFSYDPQKTPYEMIKAGICGVRIPFDWFETDHTPNFLDQLAFVTNDYIRHGFTVTWTFKNAPEEYQSIPGKVCSLPSDWDAAGDVVIAALNKISNVNSLRIEFGNEANVRPDEAIVPYFGCYGPEEGETEEDYYQAGLTFGQYVAHLYDRITEIEKYQEIKFFAGGLVYEDFELHGAFLRGLHDGIDGRPVVPSFHSYAYSSDAGFTLGDDEIDGDPALVKENAIREEIGVEGPLPLTETNRLCKPKWMCGEEFRLHQAEYVARAVIRAYAGKSDVSIYSFKNPDWNNAYLMGTEYNDAAHALAYLYQLLKKDMYNNPYQIVSSQIDINGIEMHTFMRGTAILRTVWVNEYDPNNEYEYEIPGDTTLVTDHVGNILAFQAGDVVTLGDGMDLYIFNDTLQIFDKEKPNLNDEN